MSANAPHAVPRPHNLRRSLVHMASGLVALAVIQLVPDRSWLIGISGAFAVAAWTMEISRRFSTGVNALLMRFFKPIAHAHEATQVNSATWYATALFLLSFTCSPLACSIAVMVLGVADPVAAFVGRRWGTVRLRSGRSFEGFVGFLTSAALIGLATMRVFYPELGVGVAVALAGTGALVGAVTELVTTRWDDNFAIPVAVAFCVSMLGATLGLPITG